MINKSRNDTIKKLKELKQEMQTMNGRHRKELEFVKRFQTKIQEIKNFIQTVDSRFDQCEESVKLQDRDAVADWPMMDTLKQQGNMKH